MNDTVIVACPACNTLNRAPPIGAWAWRGWSFDWPAEPGEHRLACRATDAAGDVQPLESPWNYQGMGNNGVQSLEVTVRTAP